jgi:hypothetical protein
LEKNGGLAGAKILDMAGDAARPPLPRVRKDSQGTTRRRSFGEIQSMRRANELEPIPASP